MNSICSGSPTPARFAKKNQDHFLLGTVNPQLVIHGTSLPEPDTLPLRGERSATIMLVADGVGSGTAGRSESPRDRGITRYVSSTLRCYPLGRLRRGRGVLRCPAQRPRWRRTARCEPEAAGRPDAARMATPRSTLGIAVWRLAVRGPGGETAAVTYHKDGELRRATRDQTMAQRALVDRGARPAGAVGSFAIQPRAGERDRWRRPSPEVTRVDVRKRGSVVLLCTDGLTKARLGRGDQHQSQRDGIVRSRLCRELLDLALERGGSDNITVLAVTGNAKVLTGAVGRHMRATTLRLIPASMIVSVILGCGGGNPQPPAGGGTPSTPAAVSGGGSLGGREWSLTSLGGAPAEPGNGGKPATLTFSEADSKVSGFAGCNRLAGSYQAKSDSLRIGPLALTRMACQRPAWSWRRNLAPRWMRPEAIGSPGTGSISLGDTGSWQVSKPSDGCDELARTIRDRRTS